MIINCPVCGGQLTITPQHFGNNVNCPHCTRVFQVPPAAALPARPMPHGTPPSPVPPHLLQATAAQPSSSSSQIPTRSEVQESEAVARYYHQRGKSMTTLMVWGIVLAVGAPLLIGGMIWGYHAIKSSEEQRVAGEFRKTAIAQAERNLSVRNFKNFRNLEVSGDQDAPVVTGEAEKEGEFHRFQCKFRITETSDTIAWTVESIDVDGTAIYSRQQGDGE